MVSKRTPTRLIVVGIAALLVAALSSPARSDDPVTSAVRFNREIIRIFQRKCLACHAPGGIAMSLATHREARPWARAIREEIVEQRMPPWSAARGYSRFESDIGLTPRELTTILTWVDGGVPKGDDSDLPRPASSAGDAAGMASGDRTVALPPMPVPGGGEDVVRRITVQSGLSADRWVQRLRFRPGDRRLLRAAFVTIAPPRGTATAPVWAGAWTPWQHVIAPPGPGAFLVRAGSRLTIELHYRGLDTASVDRSAVDMEFAASGGSHESTSLTVPARGARRAAERPAGELVLARPSTVWALRPDSLAEGQSLEVTARTPDGSVQVLLWIPHFHADWPAPFVLAEPVALPRGTTVRVTAGGTPHPAGARAILAVHP